jgi:hypothetical protein
MRNLLLASAAMSGLLVASSAWAGSWVAVTPVTNSVTFAAFGITDGNVITGDYTDTSGIQHGFVGPEDGSNYTSFDDPGGTTQPRGISKRGWIAGFDSGTTDTWERSPGGTLKAVTKAGTALTGVAQGLNSSNVFTADYIDPTTGATVPYLGLKYKFQSKVKLSITNAGSAVRGIDTAGDVVGWFYDPTTGLQHGFMIVGGTATQLDFPNATYTVMEGLNNHGIASGQFEDTNNAIHGFYYKISTGKFKQLDAPGAATTQVWGLNDKDVITASIPGAGSYVYCIHALTCPAAAKVVVHAPPRAGAKPAQP